MSEVEAGTFANRSDRVEYLDRLFFVRRDKAGVDQARAPEDLIAFQQPPTGEWVAVVADYPQDAFVHVRDHSAVDPDDGGACSDCFVKIEGRFATAAEAVAFARLSLG